MRAAPLSCVWCLTCCLTRCLTSQPEPHLSHDDPPGSSHEGMDNPPARHRVTPESHQTIPRRGHGTVHSLCPTLSASWRTWHLSSLPTSISNHPNVRDCEQYPHVAGQLLRVLRLLHLPLLSFLAHLRFAQRPAVSAHALGLDAGAVGLHIAMSLGQEPPYAGRHATRPASILVQRVEDEMAPLASKMTWQPH